MYLIPGNAGFYEIGIMTTPLALDYSVLGWNHPGFGGSTVRHLCYKLNAVTYNSMVHTLSLLFIQGRPYPSEDQNAIDAVMQFAINALGFHPENILLYGWSIGGYSALYAATQYPNIKGVVRS